MLRRYPAVLKRTIDGDTVVLSVDLGFHVSVEVSFRLARINCAELGEVQAQKAKEFTTEWLLGQLLDVVTGRRDRYGRWIAEIYRVGEETSLSDALLGRDLAVPYRCEEENENY